MFKNLKAVFFDGMGTVVQVRPSFSGAFAQVCRDAGYPVTDSAVDELMAHIERLELERLACEEGRRVDSEKLHRHWVKMNLFVFESLGISGDAERLAYLLEERLAAGEFTALYPETESVLSRIKGAGLVTGIISNGTACLHELYEALGLANYTDTILVSALAGWEKPSPEIFRLALDPFDLQPDQCLYVGDHYQIDVQGAQDFGMKAVLINRSGQQQGCGCRQIANLEELLPLLGL